MNQSNRRVSLRMLVSAYRNAAQGGLRIGFRYAPAQLWDSERQELRSITLRNEVRLFITSSNTYHVETESIDSGPISRRAFWLLLRRYAMSRFRQINIRVRERSQLLKDLLACRHSKSNTKEAY